MSEHEQNLGKEGSEYGVRMNLSIEFNDEMTRANRNRLHTIIFEDEDEYVRFTDHVWDNLDDKGLEPTNVPINMSFRAPRWILEETKNQFSMRLVTQQDVDQAIDELHEQRRQGRSPLDAESLANFHVPGIPRDEA